MGLFAKKPEQRTSQTRQVLVLPLSAHEAGEVVALLTAIRNGDRGATQRALAALQRWEPVRAVTALGTLSERYLRYLIAAGVLHGGGETEKTGADLERIRLAIPEALRPGADVVFDAMAITAARENQNVQQRISQDIDGAVVGLSYLCAAFTTIINEVPGTAKPSVGEMLHGIAAPW